MLPWKKSKLELIEEDKPSKQKGYAVSLNYAALASFAKSCPESALYRVGSMFKSKRRKVKITGDDPTYTVLYLGNATTIQSKGDGCTDAAVAKIWAKSDAGKSGTKMRLTVSSQGVRMVHVDDKAGRPGHLYLLHRITYCVADPRLPKVFAWIYRHEMKHKAVMLRCHAVLVSRPEKAKAVALLLYQTSAAALAEFKRLKRRDDARHQQQQLIGERSVPLVPLRKLLNAQCCYKPPVERSRSAPKLGSITEDPLGEEQEEEEEEEEEATHFECEDVLDTPGGGLVARDDQQELTQIINHLGEMSIGNDLRTLKADLKVTRLLSGESTGSDSSADSDLRLSNGLERIGVQSPA
ncbi:protein FAM43A [Nerophis ophidion]|uniref:protein FAM43A n=1 Tax=Nerophis ophidion TaxID=159077 RepID=UPI002ADFD5C6|nr:protein FAM43A [Nerophis ophidion]XP_061739907.1 protein FAM43A [Nerophis ophidion]XP_061739908.1 protein FAM43A [Nerophis ophidion]XP_061739909.1 protein FAM43A [Nerophis ophidion]XP_061739910.1 protein FAM43A [Nerophis ophidion]XP_061739911.1 protein FAM43A [Nerophis ophidion]XP_061739912.1 protein FAM43A [Nerophis ophidion]XP_061739913.1 protein FAM43A [Nerophis ophidion]XP_061739915.1 protein FAM43A [Nerophis ophidion]XP_061739916.1 protein FAM43A [Nerophis ophidion]XP_061739917.1 